MRESPQIVQQLSGSGEFWYLSCGDGQSIGHWVFPSLQRRGGRAIKKKNPFRYGTAGVVAHKSRCSIRFETWCVSDHPEGVNELAGERLNSPPKLGGVPARPSSSTKGRAGGVVPKQVVARFYLGTTPSAPALVASRHFINGAATPPNLGVPLPGRAGPITARNFSIGPEPSMIKRRRGTRQR